MSFVPNDGKSNKCTKCAKTVYPNESIRVASGVYHKGCLRCYQCAITLNLNSVVVHQNKPYCNTHCSSSKNQRMSTFIGQRGGRGGATRGRGGAPVSSAGVSYISILLIYLFVHFKLISTNMLIGC